MSKKVAIIEDEAELATLLEYNLGRQGLTTRVISGTKGAVELATQELEFRFMPVTERPATGRHSAPAPEIIDHKGFNALAAELEGFAAAINGERPYPITAEEVLHGVAAFEAIVRSAALHQPVKVS